MHNLVPPIRVGISALAVAAVISFGGVVLSPAAQADYAKVAATTALRVRATPSTSAAVIGVLQTGQVVSQTGPAQNGWLPISYQGGNYWISASYTTLVSGGTGTVIGQAVATTTVNVRAQATTLSSVLGRLTKGQSVDLTGGDHNGWTPVNFQGKGAWIATRYLTAASTPQQAAPAATSTMIATTTVNVRAQATTASTRLGSLAKGGSIQVTGATANGWTPVLFNGRPAWIASQYLSAPATNGLVAAGVRYATTAVNVRTGPATSYQKVGLLGEAASIQITGRSQNGWTEVIFNGAACWISSTYLAADPPHTDPEPNPVQGPGTGVVQPQTASLVEVVKARFPQIKTVYTLRAGSTGDHGNGLAADFMLPNYKANNALGWEIADYLQQNAAELRIQYIMFDQKIWNISRAGEGWRTFADRGNDTDNHLDHVHVSMQQ